MLITRLAIRSRLIIFGLSKHEIMKIFRKIVSGVYFLSLLVSCRNIAEESGWVEVNGQRLFYTVRGPEDGKPIVLMHGNGGSHRSMRTQSLQLSKAGYRVYTPDTRGHGQNAPLEEYHYTDFAEDCYQFVQALGLSKPLIGGWSDGGINALMVEMMHPGTAGLIVAAGANLSPDCGDNFEEFKQWILENDSPITRMMLTEPQIDPSELSAIKCPTLVIAGSKDVISVEHTTLIADSIPGSELVIVEGATHSSYIKKNPRLGRYMLDFMSRYGY